MYPQPRQQLTPEQAQSARKKPSVTLTELRVAGAPPEPWVYPEIKLPIGTIIPLDEYAGLLPSSGFLLDFVKSKTGSETSPFFNLWAGLWLLAVVARRRVLLEWEHTVFVPNIYTILLSPPGVVHKTGSINHATGVMRALTELCRERDPVEAFWQDEVILTGKGTAESLGLILRNRKQSFILDGKTFTLNRGALGTIAVSELTTFINKSTYNLTLVDKLTDLYDGQDEQTELTLTRGREHFTDLYVNFIAGTTPGSLKDSLPETAFGGGFMSRTMIPGQVYSRRVVPIPFKVPGYPRYPDLAERLYWCVKNTCGDGVNTAKGVTMTFTEEAYKYYATVFYPRARALIMSSMDAEQHAINRMTQIVLKVAMLLRMAEYREGLDITEENIRLAEIIVQQTYNSSTRLVREAVAPTDHGKYANAVKSQLYRHKAITRRAMLKALSGRGVTSAILTSLISDLVIEGFAEIIAPNGRDKLTLPCNNPQESYLITTQGKEEYLLENPDV